MHIETFKMTERTKDILDALDGGLRCNEAARALQISKNVIAGERARYGLEYGGSLVVALAERFPVASAQEIAEACGRDKAPQILASAGIVGENRIYRRTLVKEMRAALPKIAAEVQKSDSQRKGKSW